MKRYTNEEMEWLKENYPILGSKKCMEYLHRSKSSICQTARRLGCSVSSSLKNKLHSDTLIHNFRPTILPDTFLNVNTKETAYVLGLLWADGWVQHTNDYSINIKLIKEDFIELLPVFYSLGEWKRYDYFPKNRKPTIQLRVSGKSLVDYLLNLDYHSKSISPATKVLSTIPNHLIKYWWRGYFDGDGHIRSIHPYRLEFSAPWNQDWSFLPTKYPFSISITTGKRSYSKARLTSKGHILEFGTMIWKNWDGIGLYRKYNKYMELLNKKSRIY
jgi:hypothetical protein